MWVHRRSEEPCPTKVKSYWKRPKLTEIGKSLKCITTKDFSSKREIPEVDPENRFLNKFIERGLQVAAPTQLMKHYTDNKILNLGIHQLLCSWSDTNKTADDFLQYVCQIMNTNDCIEAFEKSKAQGKSNVWHELRYGRITASKIYDVSRCKTPAGALVESIIRNKNYDTPAMQRGRSLEESVIFIMEKTLGLKIQQNGIILSPLYLGASLDGFTEDRVIEVKCPSSEKNRN